MSEESNNDRDEETKDYENLEEKNGRPISESKAISAQQDRKRRYKQKTNIAGNSNKNRNLKKKTCMFHRNCMEMFGWDQNSFLNLVIVQSKMQMSEKLENEAKESNSF